MNATHTANLPTDSGLPPLSDDGRKAHVFPGMTSHPLLSIGQFCDDGYEAVFTADKVFLHKHGKRYPVGTRNCTNKLWHIDLTSIHLLSPATDVLQPPTCTANSAYTMTTLRDLVQYLHRACYSPVVQTWTKAIDAGFFTTWPGLTSAMVRKHLPKSMATAKGHLKQDRQNVRSTQPKPTTTTTTPAMTTVDSHQGTAVRTQCAFVQTVCLSCRVYSDQTGRFPQTSSRGNKYVMVFYDYDSSAILAEPLKSRAEAELLRAFKKLHALLSDRGFHPNYKSSTTNVQQR